MCGCVFCLTTNKTHFKCSSYTARLPVWSTNKHNVATKLISYERYGEILFQKVASGYLLHFVQDGSSKNALEKQLLRKNINNKKTKFQIVKLHGPTFILEYQKT